MQTHDEKIGDMAEAINIQLNSILNLVNLLKTNMNFDDEYLPMMLDLFNNKVLASRDEYDTILLRIRKNCDRTDERI
jgi:hypothetical protein